MTDSGPAVKNGSKFQQLLYFYIIKINQNFKKKKKKKKNLGRKSIMQSMDDYLKKNTALSLQGRGNFINLALI